MGSTGISGMKLKNREKNQQSMQTEFLHLRQADFILLIISLSQKIWYNLQNSLTHLKKTGRSPIKMKVLKRQSQIYFLKILTKNCRRNDCWCRLMLFREV